jgi:DNA-binding NarL/FixJ family response regulator
MRVVIAEDHALMLEGLAVLLERDGAEVVGRAENAPDLIRKAGAHKPDLVVTDIRMPPATPTTGCRRRSASAPSIRRSRSSSCPSTSCAPTRPNWSSRARSVSVIC